MRGSWRPPPRRRTGQRPGAPPASATDATGIGRTEPRRAHGPPPTACTGLTAPATMTGDVSRRDLVRLLAIAAAAGIDPRRLDAADGPERLLEFEPLGNVTLLHPTDTHATTPPAFFREPDPLIGVRDRGGDLVGDRERRGLFAGDFVAHNVRDGWGDRVFRPSTIREVGGVSVGLIGQAFPYTPVAHPRRFVPDLTFGIREDGVQALVNELRDDRKADLVVLLSHNGVSVDRKLAAPVRGLDAIPGGPTHDALPQPIVVGRPLVVESGSHGKFLSRLDLDVRRGRIAAHRYRLIPVLARHVPEDAEMARLLRELASPWEAKLGERLAVSESLLYRRGNFNGTFDELILDALLKRFDAQVAVSPGFRWGVTILPGQESTLADVYAHT